ncbi:MAG: hypothetical protein WCF04_09965 [Candidatus Nanopelagicales bacterium]
MKTLARADTPHGEIALRDRGGITELVVNGVFAMDSVDVSSELALAEAAGPTPGNVLVGGLGLGFTAARLLDLGAAAVEVVELAGPLIDWARAGLTPTLGRVASDPRVRLHHGDIVDWLGDHPGPWDAILLDVDNGPSFLIHEGNARVYGADWLRLATTRLAPDGCLVVWCETRSPELAGTLAAVPLLVTERLVAVQREGRDLEYALYVGRVG